MVEPYEYQPLAGPDHIRLLVFGSPTPKGEVNFTIEHVSLSEIGHFDALSYCWGAIQKTEEVSCDGFTIQVRPNLFSALQHLGRSKDFRRLWVDAICINQKDHDEKTHQIPLMGKIYATARQTVAWLGDSGHGRGDAVQFIKSLQDEPKDTSSDIANALSIILDSPWFERKWVVQEVVLAKQVVMAIGNEVIPMELLSSLSWPFFLSSLQRKEDIKHAATRSAYNLKSMTLIPGGVLRTSSEDDLLNIIRVTTQFKVTEEKDYLYALYGLFDNISFSVDYSESYAVSDMFVDFTRWMIEEYSGLKVLSCARVGCPYCVGPSWAACHHFDFRTRYPLDLLSHFDAGCGQLNTVVGSNDKQNLHLTGALVDTVEIVMGDFPRLNDDFDSGSSPRQGLMESAYFTNYHIFSADRRRRLCTAMVLGVDQEKERVSEDTIFQVDEYVRGVSDVGAELVARSTRYWWKERSLCLTTDDRYAWVPTNKNNPGPEKGDYICIFLGGRVPYLVRPRPGGTYTFLGECWVEGIMYGEALDFPGFKTETITLV